MLFLKIRIISDTLEIVYLFLHPLIKASMCTDHSRFDTMSKLSSCIQAPKQTVN